MLCDKCGELCRITSIGTLRKMGSPIDVVVYGITFNNVEFFIGIRNTHEIVDINPCSWIRSIV